MNGATPALSYSPTTGLVVVDMQIDFADPAGSLYVHGGEQIGAEIRAQVDAARVAGSNVAFTQDWHPDHTPHFAIDGGIWPVHCVAGSPGAELVPELANEEPVVRKGAGPEDGYSGFSVADLETGEIRGTELSTILDENGIMDLVVVGLAGDWCVKATAIDGVRLGYTVVVPLALTRFVELNPGDTERAIAQMRDAGVRVLD